MLLLPAVSFASTVWKGDFETGDLSQWTRPLMVSSDRLRVVDDPVREGRHAVKVTVKQGDDPINASGNRNELVYVGPESSGSEFYYKWSTLFPEDFPRSSRWQLFAQWHHEGCCGSPPLEFFIIDDVLQMRVGGSSGQVLWRAPMVRGKWHDFVLHVKWSSDSRVGFVELYHDGQLAVPRRNVATQYPGERNVLQFGLYRDTSISQVGTLFHDGFVMATRLEDVMPPSSPRPEPQPQPQPVVQPSPGMDGETPPSGVRDDPQASTDGVVPGSPELETVPPVGCGASATGGGVPLLALAGLAMMALLGRRKSAFASVRRGRSSSR